MSESLPDAKALTMRPNLDHALRRKGWADLDNPVAAVSKWRRCQIVLGGGDSHGDPGGPPVRRYAGKLRHCDPSTEASGARAESNTRRNLVETRLLAVAAISCGPGGRRNSSAPDVGSPWLARGVLHRQGVSGGGSNTGAVCDPPWSRAARDRRVSALRLCGGGVRSSPRPGHNVGCSVSRRAAGHDSGKSSRVVPGWECLLERQHEGLDHRRDTGTTEFRITPVIVRK